MTSAVNMDISKQGRSRQIVILSPELHAISGVSTHANLLIRSALNSEFVFVHFCVGSEGVRETAFQKLLRLMFCPLHLAGLIARHGQLFGRGSRQHRVMESLSDEPG
jgi:hypothetical protein